MIRARFYIKKSDCGNDYRPVKWPIKYPYWCSGGLLLADTPGRYTPYQIGDCAFESKEEALKHAEEQRTNLIKSLKLQIHELENLKFECDD